MELSAYQRAAGETSHFGPDGSNAAIMPVLALADEVGSILAVFRKYLLGGLGVSANREMLRKELGDLLWYAAAVATAHDLDLEEVAEANLARARDRYPCQDSQARFRDLPVFDAAYPARERFPRCLFVSVTGKMLRPDRPGAVLRLLRAEPNPFPDGPVVVGGRTLGFRVGATLGDPLTDNSRRSDAYRFHDAIHLGFMAVLGWSPAMRSLLRVKRRSSPETDECEDGARAIFAEEGLAAVLSRLAPARAGFLTPASIDGDVIEVARAAATGLEAQAVPGWAWQAAIHQGFRAMSQLAENDGGYLLADLDTRQLTYRKALADDASR